MRKPQVYRYTDRQRLATLKWRSENRVKARAERIAHRLVPLKPNCEECGSTENLMRHHDDYTKPLEVRTLCKQCHEKIPAIEEPDEVPNEIRYLMGSVKVAIMVRGNVAGCDDKRFWRVKVVATGEEMNVYPAKLSVLPYPHGFRKDRRPKGWQSSLNP